MQIMPWGLFASQFIPFIEKNFNEDVRFILLKDSRSSTESRTDEIVFEKSNVYVITRLFQLYTEATCRQWLRKSDSIILNWVDPIIFLLLSPFIAKIALLFWGADLQNVKLHIAQGGIRGHIEKSLIERVGHIITLLPGDYDELCSVCQPQARWFLGMIWSDTFDNIAFRPSRVDQDMGKRFLVGNSATRTNRHIEVFEQLSKFVNMNIVVFVPLSYGDDAYREEVIVEGKRLLGKSFRPLLNFMDYAEYAELLGTISVAFFNNNRQQGMGNIITLLAQGAKVYLSDEGPMLKDFTKDGFHVFSIKDSANLSYNEIVSFDEKARSENMERGSFAKWHDEAVGRWRAIFESLRSCS